MVDDQEQRSQDGNGGLAIRRLEQVHELLRSVRAGEANSTLYWTDPFSRDGAEVMRRARPVASKMRLLAEEATLDLLNHMWFYWSRRGYYYEAGEWKTETVPEHVINQVRQQVLATAKELKHRKGAKTPTMLMMDGTALFQQSLVYTLDGKSVSTR